MGQAKSKLHFAWLVLVGLCITVGLGKAALNNTSGLFITPISQDLGVGVGNLTLYLSISSIVTMIFLPIGGKIMAKYDARIVLTIAIILQAGSFAAFGLMNSVWGWYIFSIPLAVGGVFITVIAGPVLVERWFEKRNGLALGVMTAIGGLLGAFTQPIVGGLISDIGWRNTYFAVGIAVIIIVVPIILLLLRQNPAAKGLLPYGAEESTGSESNKPKQKPGIPFAVASKSLAFILLALFFFIITAISSFTVHIPTYLVNQGYTVTFAGSAMSAMMIGVFLGSLLFGYLIDRIGVKNTSLIAMVLGLLSIVLLLLFTQSVAMIIIALLLFGFMTTSVGTLAPAITSALFGGRDYSQIYATASMGLAIASIIALPAYGYIFDFTGSYLIALIAVIIMFLLNIVFIIVAFRNKEKLVKEGHWN
ncbi:MFS transporter [Gracilibacillus marinus]|uniref:MFS transporter n=1 Tax=Gracilibacillus marinus TaxID=630535 RepID=A0ABV8VSG7_9BACI